MTEARAAVNLKLSPDDAEVDQLLHPSRFYARPLDVVADDLLTIEERRAILSSWASDACAVTSKPPLRLLLFAHAPVRSDEIMDALPTARPDQRFKVDPGCQSGAADATNLDPTARACCSDVNEVVEQHHERN